MFELQKIPFSYIEFPGGKPFKVESSIKKTGLREGSIIIYARNVRELHKLTRLWNGFSKTRKYNIVPIRSKVLLRENTSMLQQKRSNVRDRKNVQVS